MLGAQAKTLRTIRHAERLVQTAHVPSLDSATRYRTPPSSFQRPDLVLLAHSMSGKQTDRSPGAMLHALGASSPFPPPALRDQSAGLSVAMAAEYTRAVRQVEGYLRRQAGKIAEEATRLDHQKERLEKLIQSIRTALLINCRTTEERTQRPATETEKDKADHLLLLERKSLYEMKRKLITLLGDVLTQLQALAQSSRQLHDCAFERSRVIDLLPHHGSSSASARHSPSPLSLKPDPSGPFTPECKEVIESSAAVLEKSQELSKTTEQVMQDVINEQKTLQNSVNECLLRRIAETQSLQQRLTLSSAATRQAIYRKQREMDYARYSHGRALGPVSSKDLFCRERMNRPFTQVYERHSRSELPESRLLTQGSTMLKQHLEHSGKTVKVLQVTHSQLEADLCAKRVAMDVDSSIVHLRRRNMPQKFVQSAKR